MSNDGSLVIGIEAEDSGVKEALDEVEDKAKEAADGMDELGDSAKETGDGFGITEVAIGSFVGNAISGLISAVGNAVSSFFELSESTRDARDDMAKLETAFSSSGGSVEAGKKSYEDFYAILGESDRSVEAVNHLAELTQSEEELAKWSDIAAGVTAKFGDSLPIEGLTEAANHTAKLGEVQGPLADALEWIGMSTDDFNKQLAACNTEEERATLITETLNREYKAAADEYNELTASTQEARRATSAMETAQANMGAALEPVLTAWTQLKANAMEAIVPVVEKAVEKLGQLQKWAEENPKKLEVIKGVLIGVATALGVLAVALSIGPLINTVKNAFLGLNAVMMANPVGLIVAAIAGLVAAFVYLWNNCDAFREFWLNLWENVQSIVSAGVEKVKEIFNKIVDFVKENWQGLLLLIVNPFAGAFKLLWDNCEGFREFWINLWNKISSFVSETWAKIKAWFADAWAKIKEIWSASIIKKYFSMVWDVIKGIFAVVKSVLSGNFRDAWNAIKGIWDSVSGYFSDLYNKVIGVFKNIKDDFFNIGDNIISGIWKGLSAGWDWLKSKVKNLASSLLGAAEEALGINSPSKEFAYIGRMSAEGTGVGWEDEIGNVEKEMQKDLAGMTARVQATVGAENAKASRGMGARDTGLYDLARAVGTQTAGINSLASEYRRGTGNMRPVILQLNGRELGRAVVDVGGAETARVGVQLAYS